MDDVELLTPPPVSHPPCPTLPTLSNHEFNPGKPTGQIWPLSIAAAKQVLGFSRVKNMTIQISFFYILAHDD